MEIDGLPLHPLVNDLAVSLVPLSALLAGGFALLSRWRWLTRWPLLVSTLAGLASIVLSVSSGRELFDERFAQLPPDQPLYATLQTHQDRAGQLLWLYVAFAVVVVLAFKLLPAPSRLDGGGPGHRGSDAGWVRAVVPTALVLLGLLCLTWVALTGHAGAQAAFG